ncbi:MAG: hypothetical protein ABIS92_14320 [Polyangia bacterium]
MRGLLLSALIGVALNGCLSASTPLPDSPGTATGGNNSTTGGVNGTGSTATGGNLGSGGSVTIGTGGSGAETATGGSTGTGGMVDTTGTGGNVSAGGSVGTGGRVASGGSSGAGGAVATGTGGAMGGTTGGVGFPMLRVDDPCGSLLGGNVCLHQGKTSDDGTPFMKMASVTMGGTQGTMYQVKIHVRGVVEPTHITGGTPGTPPQFVTGGSAYANNTNEGSYQQWRLTTTVPNQHYYLNIFTAGLSHIVQLIDYPQTIMIGGGSVVTLDVHDGNAHAISNTVNNPPKMAPGVSGSVMSGQYVQIDTE